MKKREKKLHGLYIIEAFARFVFGNFEPRKFIAQVKSMVEADATGVVYTSRSVQRVFYILTHTFRVYYILNTRGCHSVCTCAGFPRT